MKKITTEQISALLQTILQTNIPWQTGEAVKKLLLELPTCEEPKKE